MCLLYGDSFYHDKDMIIPIQFPVLASLIRMGHKYAVQDVLDNALARLKRYYTTDFAAWQDSAARARYVLSNDIKDAFVAIELARLTNTQSILPTAFLECCGHMPSTFLDLPDEVRPSRLDYKDRISALSSPDLGRLFRGKVYLTRYCAARILRLVNEVPCSQCFAPDACAATRSSALEFCLRGTGIRGTFDDQSAFLPLAEKFWDEDDWDQFCDRCRASSIRADNEAREQLWDRLPNIFALSL